MAKPVAKKTAKKAAAEKSKGAKAKAAPKAKAKAAPAKAAPAKAAPAKAAPKAKAAPAKAKAKAAPKAKAHRDPYELITIGITPPELAPKTDAYELNSKLADRATRPKPEALAKLPWLAQDVAYRAGYYLLTHGLREHADHPEIEICNVPGALLDASQRVLNTLANYALNHGRFAHGEVMVVSENPLAVIGFMRVGPRERGTVHDGEVLRVVFLR